MSCLRPYPETDHGNHMQLLGTRSHRDPMVVFHELVAVIRQNDDHRVVIQTHRFDLADELSESLVGRFDLQILTLAR